MSVKSVGLWAVIGMCVCLPALHGDDAAPSTGVITTDPALPPIPTEPGQAVTSGGPPVPVMSKYVLGSAVDCCGPIGGNGQIDLEPYIRLGITQPIGGAIFKETLETGWIFQGGARSLFFDQSDTGAWTIDLSISNMFNRGKRPDIQIPLRNVLVPNPTQQGVSSEVLIPRINVTTRSLNRTFVNLGFGREMYLLGTGHGGGPSWRVGFDAGGRWGNGSFNSHEIPHRTDVFGSAWAAIHTDLEVPYGGFILFGGARFEYDYSWSDILQIQNNSDMQDLNFMFSGGFRF